MRCCARLLHVIEGSHVQGAARRYAMMTQVGRRRRARRTPSETGATIPLERSLVPIRMYTDVQDRSREG